jgi:hypothetical protein
MKKRILFFSFSFTPNYFGTGGFRFKKRERRSIFKLINNLVFIPINE